MSLVIVDYGAGNIENVVRACKILDLSVTVSKDPEYLARSSHAIIPGVGAFDFGMDSLLASDLVEAVTSFAESGRPLMGICLGMHMLGNLGFENKTTQGLGLIPGEVRSLVGLAGPELRESIPHTGWDRTRSTQSSILGFDCGEDYYFTHSYYFDAARQENIDSYFEWGEFKIPAVIQSENVIGVQFHPEKSGKAGLEILARFSKI